MVYEPPTCMWKLVGMVVWNPTCKNCNWFQYLKNDFVFLGHFDKIISNWQVSR